MCIATGEDLRTGVWCIHKRFIAIITFQYPVRLLVLSIRTKSMEMRIRLKLRPTRELWLYRYMASWDTRWILNKLRWPEHIWGYRKTNWPVAKSRPWGTGSCYLCTSDSAGPHDVFSAKVFIWTVKNCGQELLTVVCVHALPMPIWYEDYIHRYKKLEFPISVKIKLIYRFR